MQLTLPGSGNGSRALVDSTRKRQTPFFGYVMEERHWGTMWQLEGYWVEEVVVDREKCCCVV